MTNLRRRTFIRASLASAAVASSITSREEARAQTSTAQAASPASEIIDVNLNLSRWPFRRVTDDDTQVMVKKLRARGVSRAWAGSFDGLLHRDVAAVNARLASDCKDHGEGLLVPFGSVNPMLPDWEDDVRRCQEEHGMPGVRLHPNYHGYSLDDPRFAALLKIAARRRLVVQIVVQMEDQRTQHPLVQVKPVDLKPLSDALNAVPAARVMVLNATTAMAMTALRGLNVTMDFAMVEGVGGVGNLLQQWPLGQLAFGSHAPLFYWESARLKLQESDLNPEQVSAVTHGNAKAFLYA